MESIKPLSEVVQSVVRSGFIISDLPNVVEELIYNSLDAGATKVSVYVGITNGYVKVEDDGSGISRDGLVLLGERYATSKLHHLHDKDVVQSFGFRGEVLCSIADTALIEIITKVHGRPNGYRKVMKGRKCLYLGIDDDRQDVGTTVIVHDLFYNQPVRRRQMQSSAKKVLHSVKKCAVRVAIVQPRVSFKVVDMESEVELLRTHSSSSPLPVLCSSFGFEASSLHELNFSQGSLKLKGYVSDPSSSFSLKAIQYIYVNSRFIIKGPIHKALNRLADMCWEQLSSDKGGKRGHAHSVPTYCVNLTCPRSSYHINLEFSRTSVEFKDWSPLLTFIEKSVMTVWSKKTKKGDSHKCEANQTRTGGKEKLVEKDWLLKTCQIPIKRLRIEKIQNEQLSAKSLNPVEMQVEDGSKLSMCKAIDRHGRNLLRSTAEFGEAEIQGEFPHQIDSSGSGGASPSKCIFDIDRTIDDCLWEPSKALKSWNKDPFKNYDTLVQKDDDYGDFLPDSRWECGLRVDNANTRNSKAENGWSCGVELQNDDLETLSSEIQTPFKYNNNPRYRIKHSEANRSCSSSIGKADDQCLGHNFSKFQRSHSHNGAARNRPLSKLYIESDMWEDLGVAPVKCHESLSSHSRSFDREHSSDYLSEQVRAFTSCFSPNTDQHSKTSLPFLSAKPWDLEQLIQDESLERRPKARICDAFDQCNDDEEEFYHDGLSSNYGCENSFTTHLDSNSIFRNGYAGAGEGASEFSPHGHSVDDISTVRYDDIFSEEPHSTSMESRARNYRYSPSICWSPSKSFKTEAQIDAYRCEALSPNHTPRERQRKGHHKCSPADLFSASSGGILADKIFSPCLDFQSKYHPIAPSSRLVSSTSVDKGPKIDQRGCQALEQNCSFSSQSERSTRSKRSHSAPPIYRARRRFSSIVDYLITTAESLAVQTAPQVCNMTERVELGHTPSSLFFNSQHDEQHEMSCEDDSPFSFDSSRLVKETPNITQISNRTQDDMTRTSSCSPGNLSPVWDSESLLVKWREDFPHIRLLDIANYHSVGEQPNQLTDENAILDIDSCMLHLAGDSLVPNSINRSCLESAKVLLQVDKKFIPVVAGGNLAVIDQHAADERIRLEEMREKILSGEIKSITYLEEEKDLVLPEMAYQLLCNYADHVQHWGWICNSFCQDSGSFNKNLNLLNGQPTHLSLLAVPCILGVNLTDADLLEFLEQLADTDGSSTIPPAILRILNYKACRGAIMFGDRLLPSECNLLVEELKRTSLCFQCAHGRPTTVPLVNLEALHKGIAQLGSWNEGSTDLWHGLHRQEISIERARRRLDVARFCE